ncbi:MAG: hypothetical protein R2851_10255 [Caldilineaceae bacterium]
MGTGVQPSLWSRLHEAAMPALLLTGAEDAKFCAIAQAMVQEMPRAAHHHRRGRAHGSPGAAG